MRQAEFAVFLARLAERRFVIGVLIVLVDHVRAVAIGHVEAGAVRPERDVGRQEHVARLHAGLRAFVFALGVNAGFHRRVSHPNGVALERELGELLETLITGDVEEFFAALVVDFEAVAAALKLLAERADEFAVVVEHEDRRVILLILVPFVDHVQVAGFVERDVVRRLPRVLVRQLRPVVQRFVFVFAFTQDDGDLVFFAVRMAGVAITAAAPAAAFKNSRRRIVDDIAHNSVEPTVNAIGGSTGLHAAEK